MELVNNFKRSKLLEVLNLENSETISFSLGKPDKDTIPVDLLKKIELASDLNITHLQYFPADIDIKRNISELMKRRGIRCYPEQVFVTTGAQQAINLLASGLHKNKMYAMAKDLMYPGFKQVIERLNIPVLSFESYASYKDAGKSSLDKNISFIYSVTAGNNPSGYTLCSREIKSIIDISKKHTAPVLEDDAYGFTGEGQSDLIFKASSTKTYYIGTVSKCIAPSLRVGWIIMPENEISYFAQLKESYDLNIRNYSHYILNKIFELIDIDNHLNVIQQVYAYRRKSMLDALKAYMPNYVKFNQPNTGFFIWLELPDIIDSGIMLEYCLRHYNLSYIPGAAFTNSSNYNNCLRLSYSCCEINRIDIGIKMLSQAIDTFYKLGRKKDEKIFE